MNDHAVDRAEITAVIFDWGGTLTPWHSVDALQSWHAAVGDAAQAARLHAAEARAWRRGTEEHRSATLEEIFAAAGIAHSAQILAAYHTWWEPHTYTDPDVPALFAGLRERGLRVGILSNTIWPRHVHEQIFERDAVSEFIDGAVYSCEIPWTKPHPEAFRAALAAVGVSDPSRAVFVGDRPFDDIHGAKSVGMRAILVPHSVIPADQHGPVAGEPDAIAHRLGDVLGIVDGWREASLTSC